LIWHPKKYAFRAGLNTHSWTNDNIGLGSVALCYGPIASGENSVALGQEVTASGLNAMALGSFFTTASGRFSIAIGAEATCSGDRAISMGFSNANGREAIALGGTASGNNAYSIGGGTASGNYSTAMGRYVSTNLKEGSFVIGDLKNPQSFTTNDQDNQMMMRFSGGYKFFTNSPASIGVQIAPGGNSWTTISDINRKENFLPVDGEDFLKKLSTFQSVSWNYKGQDAKQYRHYGPMAQEFFAAFGKDQYGIIGDDTTINQADFDGINLIAIQALEKRTTELKKGNDELKKEITGLKQTAEQLQTDNTAQNEDIKKLKEKIAELAKTLKALSTHQ